MSCIVRAVTFAKYIFPGFKMKQENSDINRLYAEKRQQMVDLQIIARGVKDTSVLNSMRKIPRHLFIPSRYRDEAYADHPLPIGHDQTISQPYIVAYMTECLELEGYEKVLEIGTGCGYQAAVLAEIVKEVYSVEIVEGLYTTARKNLENLHYINIQLKCGDGYEGWPENGPYDAIIVTAAPEKVPPPLLDQLKLNGKLIAPVGDVFQELVLLARTSTGFVERKLLPVRFVPMTGKASR